MVSFDDSWLAGWLAIIYYYVNVSPWKISHFEVCNYDFIDDDKNEIYHWAAHNIYSLLHLEYIIWRKCVCTTRALNIFEWIRDSSQFNALNFVGFLTKTYWNVQHFAIWSIEEFMRMHWQWKQCIFHLNFCRLLVALVQIQCSWMQWARWVHRNFPMTKWMFAQTTH